MSAGDWKDLYSAATKGDLELVKYHINQGVNQNYQHPEILSTPLVAAILSGHTDVAIFLINTGADLDIISDFDNLTPLQAAYKVGNQLVIRELSNHGVNRWNSILKKFF